MDSSGCFLDGKEGCCTYLEDALLDDVFIYIVEFLGQFHVNAEIFLLLERTNFVVMLH